MKETKTKIIVIGGGAAGFFGAITFADNNPNAEIIILEKSTKLLAKVEISGGGRCNVTNGLRDNEKFSENYPRGKREMLGPLNRFNNFDTIKWFNDKDVNLKIEEDGRVFPSNNNSKTIINCLVNEAKKRKIEILVKEDVENIFWSETELIWKVVTTKNKEYQCDAVFIATGSNNKMWEILKQLGHKIIEPVPSLFTFNISDDRIKGLEGISHQQVELRIENSKLVENGPLLFTHWGLSGPVVLRLSAWGAIELAKKNYQFELRINFTERKNKETFFDELLNLKKELHSKEVSKYPLFNIPTRLWIRLNAISSIDEKIKWKDVPNNSLRQLAANLCELKLNVTGKSIFKEEFVTSGGVDLKEINFKRMESKLHKNLFFAGEVLNIDGITGGFNFQAAWTTAFIAGSSELPASLTEQTDIQANIT
ncbi:MAG: aminoacetone oxidase family FAD-binding enzyme [Chlorobiaceae bacterium]|nr:aminoacetone oxidase family FAD-binding enzyme [Chlorobiaceae bacterium]MBA4309204.1 aminoacetone oxidase family FAD-binding enzyme [Chlorobiaceae bacterium]